MNATSDATTTLVAPPTGRLWSGVAVFAAGWIIGLGLVPFVTGSDLSTFWDKLRALFVRNAKAVFPEKATASAG